MRGCLQTGTPSSLKVLSSSNSLKCPLYPDAVPVPVRTLQALSPLPSKESSGGTPPAPTEQTSDGARFEHRRLKCFCYSSYVYTEL